MSTQPESGRYCTLVTRAEKAILQQYELRKTNPNQRIDNWFFLLEALPVSQARIVAAVCQEVPLEKILDAFNIAPTRKRADRYRALRERTEAARHKIMLVGMSVPHWRWCALEYAALIARSFHLKFPNHRELRAMKD